MSDWKPGDRVRLKSQPDAGAGFVIAWIGPTMVTVRWDDPSRGHGPFTASHLELALQASEESKK